MKIDFRELKSSTECNEQLGGEGARTRSHCFISSIFSPTTKTPQRKNQPTGRPVLHTIADHVCRVFKLEHPFRHTAGPFKGLCDNKNIGSASVPTHLTPCWMSLVLFSPLLYSLPCLSGSTHQPSCPTVYFFCGRPGKKPIKPQLPNQS